MHCDNIPLLYVQCTQVADRDHLADLISSNGVDTDGSLNLHYLDKWTIARRIAAAILRGHY